MTASIIQPQPSEPDVPADRAAWLLFTHGYQAAFAQGVDLLEINDAAWED